MSVSVVCAWCKKPLLDAEHAKQHVAEQCAAAPWRKESDKLAVERNALEVESALKDERIATLEAENTSLRIQVTEIAELRARMDRFNRWQEALDELRAENTRLRGELAALKSPGKAYHCPRFAPSHHRIVTALADQLRAEGGDGPYCTKCHEAGYPDTMLVASDNTALCNPAGNGKWSTGVPR